MCGALSGGAWGHYAGNIGAGLVKQVADGWGSCGWVAICDCWGGGGERREDFTF